LTGFSTMNLHDWVPLFLDGFQPDVAFCFWRWLYLCENSSNNVL
jgi:hypothetical protein